MELAKGGGEMRTPRLLFPCFVQPCQIYPASWGSVWVLARVRTASHLAPPVPVWLSGQDPGPENLKTPSLPTCLQGCCPTGIYGSYSPRWGHNWKPGVEGGDRGHLSWRQKTAGGWKQERGACLGVSNLRGGGAQRSQAVGDLGKV